MPAKSNNIKHECHRCKNQRVSCYFIKIKKNKEFENHLLCTVCLKDTIKVNSRNIIYFMEVPILKENKKK